MTKQPSFAKRKQNDCVTGVVCRNTFLQKEFKMSQTSNEKDFKMTKEVRLPLSPNIARTEAFWQGVNFSIKCNRCSHMVQVLSSPCFSYFSLLVFPSPLNICNIYFWVWKKCIKQETYFGCLAKRNYLFLQFRKKLLHP